MNIKSSKIGRVTVLELTGPINLHSMRWLHDALDDFVAEGRLHLVFSLSAVTLISSSGLGALMQFSQEFKRRQGRVALAALRQTGREVMVLTRLDALFQIHDTVDQAVASLNAD
jgi:anti-sigma B factor antagonist